MPAARGFFQTTIGKKAVMAITGIILFGFVIGHLLGNLQVYQGPEAMNEYALFLRGFLHGWALWAFRAVLLVSVALHIWAATSLTLVNRAARPQAYYEQQWRESTYASRTMRWSGVIIAIFVVYHLLHLTTGTVHPSFEERDVYHNFIAGFQVVPVSLFYMAAMVLLGMHLHHGVWSMLQTLGLSHPRYMQLARACAGVIAVVFVAGNVSFPVAVLTGLLK
jgi:succinate dehydrogenase / fumarate reductase cytochrome b subunit